MHLKLSSGKWRPFCLCLNVLRWVTKGLSTLHQTSVLWIPSNLWYKLHQIPKLKCFSSHLAVVFAQSIEATCQVDNEDVVGAVLAGDAATTSEWSTILLPTEVRLILEIWLCTYSTLYHPYHCLLKLGHVTLVYLDDERWNCCEISFDLFSQFEWRNPVHHDDAESQITRETFEESAFSNFQSAMCLLMP